MKVILYKFNKKSNSTAIPDNNTEKLELDNAQVKSPSSINTPLLQLAKDKDPNGYNYIYIPAFKRYYFVQDITYNLGLWLVSCVTDVLASFRSDILNSEQYVLRSASSYNVDILDCLYTTKAAATGNTAISYAPNTVTNIDTAGIIQNYFNVNYSDGYFLIGVISDNNSGITYYQLTYNGFSELMGSLPAATGYLSL